MTEQESLSLDTGTSQVWNMAEEFHLDPFPTDFEIVSADDLYGVAAYAIPGRYSHWTHGRVYRQLKTQYDYGLSVIYEMVVNSNPAYALLLDNNPTLTNLLVVAHVTGHSDFFKHNYLFKETNRDMPHLAALRSERIKDYENIYGHQPIESFLDAVLTINEHIDPLNPVRLPKDEQIKKWRQEFKQQTPQKPSVPPKFKIPLHPDRDIIGFLRDYAENLEDWQRDILDIVRLESLYFYPQYKTKIMNEGWATFWHKNIMNEMLARGFLTSGHHEDWSHLHSGVVSPREKQLNPYHFGLVIYEWLADYFNGQLTLEETRWMQKQGWPIYPKYEGHLKDSPAIQGLRTIMETNDDQSFILNYFNYIPAMRMRGFLHKTREDNGRQITYITNTRWEDIRDGLVSSLSNCGNPYLEITDGNFNNRGELFINHKFEGLTLNIEYVKKIFPHIYHIWGRPIHIKTYLKEKESFKEAIFTYDGTKMNRQ